MGFTPLLSVILVIPVLAAAELSILAGKFLPEKSQAFKAVPAKYVMGNSQYLEAQALAAFLKLAAAAEKQGYAIRIVSGTRTFTTQKAIWEQKFTGSRKVAGKNLATTIKDETERSLEILKFSSMPGTSRHHWGTDMDLHEVKLAGSPLHNETFQKGRGKDFFDWLQVNAPQFGFCQPYNGNPQDRNGTKFAHGYQEERWHWSYRPVAATYLEAYRQNAENLRPSGFAGSKAAGHLYMEFVQNINPKCL